MLWEFQTAVHVGLACIRDELAEILGHTVDLNTPGSISRYFRDEVPDESEELYVAA